MAVSEFLKGNVGRIILTRPARESGENLGFLPGSLEEKIMPYLRPLYDALYDMLTNEEVTSLIERNIIEVAPLAFMRGRTLNNAFIILDEAQNTTVDQMLMFLTRMGFNSRCVITGDPMQTDLTGKERSGLRHAIDTLQTIPEISFTFFETNDVVRHSLLEKIIKAYGEQPQKTQKDGKDA
jgi:phosphate starvation-inducible PhoH-like protein